MAESGAVASRSSSTGPPTGTLRALTRSLGDFLRRFDFQAQCVLVEGQCLVDVLDGDADVIEDRFHPGIRDPGLGIRFMISSTTEYGSRARLATASM